MTTGRDTIRIVSTANGFVLVLHLCYGHDGSRFRLSEISQPLDFAPIISITDRKTSRFCPYRLYIRAIVIKAE